MNYINIIFVILGITLILFGISFNKKRYEKMKHCDKYTIWVRITTCLLGVYFIIDQFMPNFFYKRYVNLFLAIYSIISVLIYYYTK